MRKWRSQKKQMRRKSSDNCNFVMDKLDHLKVPFALFSGVMNMLLDVLQCYELFAGDHLVSPPQYREQTIALSCSGGILQGP